MKNKEMLKKAFCAAALVYLVLYIAGIIGQQRENYAIWTAGGAVGDIPKINYGLATSVLKAISTSFGWQAIFFLIFVMAAFFVWLKFFAKKKGIFDKERNLTISAEGTYGTAGWMTDLDFSKVLKLMPINMIKGISLGEINGKAVTLPDDTMLNKHIAVYGASGTMKSRAFVRPYIFLAAERGESIILTDSKGDLFADTSEWLKSKGYEVKILNLVTPEASDSWNCLSEIENQELMAQVFADVIIKNTTNGRGDPFWDNAEMNLLKALSLYVALNDSIPVSEKNIGTVYKILTDKSEQQLSGIITSLPSTHPAKGPFNLFRQSSETVRGSVIIGLGSRLQVFQNEIICDMTARDDINLTKPAYSKCAYFCVISDQDSTLEFLSSLFFSFLFIKLVRYADKKGEGGRCLVPVNFILDELPNIGEIVDLHKKISTVRSRAINISFTFQNLAQLKNRYPFDVWQEIIGNADTQLFLGCTDPMTAEFVSNRTGDASVMVSAERYSKSPIFKSPVHQDSQSVGKRKLLTPDEVLRIPNDEALIMLRGFKPLKVKKLDYTKYPQADALVKTSAAEHVPAHKKPYGYEFRQEEPRLPVPEPSKPNRLKPKGVIKRLGQELLGRIDEKDI